MSINFDELWKIIIDKNNKLKTDKVVNMTINGFKKAIKLGFDKGYEQGYEDGKNSKSIFEDMFGSGRKF